MSSSASTRTGSFLGLAVVIGLAFCVGMFGASVLSRALSSHTVPWQLSVGIGGPRFDPAAAQGTTVVHVEVQWPSCVSTGDDSWLTPEVGYTPWSVTITLRTSVAYATNAACSRPQADGSPPLIGYYLSALSYPVQLSEPLGGRSLFDGSSFPAAARPQHR